MFCLGNQSAVSRKAAVPARGDEQVRLDAPVETRLRARAGIGGGHGFVTAYVRERRRDRRPRAIANVTVVPPRRV